MRARALSPTQHVLTYKPIPVVVNSSLEVVMWSKGLVEALTLPADTAESQHISALPFIDEAALDEVR